jgi:polar amino acid transport system substrate-binding protein
MINLRNLKQLPDGQRDVLRAVLLVLTSWDADLFSHSEQVARELLPLAPAGQEEEWYWAGLLHDIGKITVAPGILHKRGGLSRRERKAMQQHSLKGAAILEQAGVPHVVVQGAKYHHERWDGTGYPYDIGGDQIPFVARVLSVADVYTALTNDRPYRQALPPMQARVEIERHAGTQFDPQVVERFFGGLKVQ